MWLPSCRVCTTDVALWVGVGVVPLVVLILARLAIIPPLLIVLVVNGCTRVNTPSCTLSSVSISLLLLLLLLLLLSSADECALDSSFVFPPNGLCNVDKLKTGGLGL